MDRRDSSQHPANVRPGVWLVAAACLLATLGILAELLERDEGADAKVAAVARESSPVVIAIGVPTQTAAAPRSDPAAPGIADLSAPASVPEPVPAPTRAVAMERADAPPDSRTAAEIRVLEAEAARAAASLDLIAVTDAVPPRDRAAEDARVQRLADALLVESFVQDAYRGTEFPIGYPAEERTRAGAESRVRGLTPELRRDLLDVVLQSDALAERVGPRFAPPDSGFVWEGALR